jgi:hypothetical protein
MATTTLATTLTSGIAWDYRNDQGTVDSGRIAVDSNRISQSERLADADADLVWHDHATLAHGATRDLDLAFTSAPTGLVDAFGNQLTFVKVKGFMIRNLNTDTGDVLSVGGDANALVNWVGAANDLVKIGPEGVLVVWSPSDGYGVTAATGDILQLAATTGDGLGSITYDIVVIGTSA